MNEIRTSCAPTDQTISNWESIDWNKCELEVRKLQAAYCKGSEGRSLRQGESPAMATDPLVRG